MSHEFYMSSKIWNSQMAQGGIFATDGSSAWGNANRVYVKCATNGPPLLLIFQPGATKAATNT